MKKNFLIIIIVVWIVKVEAQTSIFPIVDSLFEKGRYKLALSKLEIVPSTFDSNFKKAIIYESIDNYKKTTEFLEKALVFKDDYKAKLKLSKAYQKLKKVAKSIVIYEKLVAKDSLNLLLKYQLGKLYLITKKADNAVSLFKKLIKKDVSNAHYSYQLGVAFAQKKERNRMINSFIDTYKKDTTHVKAIAHLASNFNKLKERDSTRLFVEKGLLLDKNHINLNRLKINQLYRDKKYNEAISVLLHLDTIDKKDTYCISMLGKVYYNLDSLEKAKKYFGKLSRVDRKNFKSHTYLGHIAMKEKQYKFAGIHYRMATSIGKIKRDEEYFGLATMYYETKKPKQAIVNFEKAYSENQTSYKALFQLAKLSDDYYKDKKIGYKLYKKFMERFQGRDKDMTNFIKNRLKDIKKEYFLKGENLE